MNLPAIKELLYKVADDQLILGHRNSEWTGMGPLLEEDIAFSSMAQDKIGQSLALYTLLQNLGEAPPDTVAFTRPATRFHNCVFVELPNDEYDFSLIRHFLYDTGLAVRFEMLTRSSYQPLAELSAKIRGEVKYHTMHANIWMRQLGASTHESIGRLQASLDYALPYALGMFEESPFEKELLSEGIFEGERKLLAQWKTRVEEMLRQTQLILPDWSGIEPASGGRSGIHSEHLQPLLDEMSEVFRIDPTAEW
jgi:ring-1,2-phenylacetyl-CoA epoxidase subunit PaaC